ncbi:MAG TPA: glycoside hydrolase family 9 protein [Prolixibacteraceae bacterium]|nr:glycoside hydrolase family 9 protein [Prolixibacteraceae bacterium]
MKIYFLLVFISLISFRASALGVIRINQLGYLPHSVKVAVYISDEKEVMTSFQVYETLSGKLVFEGKPEFADPEVWGMQSAYRLNFTSFQQNGGYCLKTGDVVSPSFCISADVYKGTADFILNYMRQQRCGFNPYLNDSCHTHDGIIVDDPTRTGERIDVTGGWHDASDYLQYTTTSANAIYQLLFAYQQNPSVYGDRYNASGRPGANGIPDILDEARWGLEWLLKMNPAKNEMYNQIADDRDHVGMRLPTADTLGGYGLGKYRPVYFVTGKSQGLGKYKNRTTGVSSTAAKFSSSFALGASVFKKIDPAFADQMLGKSKEAWSFANSDLGNCQTACMVSPYFYEEDNYVDDMELAAASLIPLEKQTDFQGKAKYWGELEPVTPWMELNRARHYQYYPFINLGHALLAKSTDQAISVEFSGLMKQGLDQIKKYASNDPFRIGVPFVWCSNNFVVAAATQAMLYRKITGDNSYEEMEVALTDWLFGCNPWGTSMICGLPAGGDYPESPHSSITYILKETTTGGLVDGAVNANIYRNLRGIHLLEADEYAAFQNGKAVYHDDPGDYSSNEPTMDGTASLSYLLSSLESDNKPDISVLDSQGALIRNNPDEKKVYLIFSAHEYAEGGEVVVQTLKKFKAKASFFFTGYFYSNPENKSLIHKLLADGHYLGAHSDAHLLYAEWTKRDSSLVDQACFTTDLKANYQKMEAFGINPEKANVFLPPYEWYNAESVEWSRQLGLKVINFTPGIRSNADYTSPEMKNYRSSEMILNDIEAFEKNDPNGLNGCIVLIHLGTVPERTDKFYNRLGNLLSFLKKKGYSTERF